MKFIQHYSGSKGNFYQVVAENGKRLLIDPGVPWKKILQALAFDLTDIAGCLVTHEHKDHCKAVKQVMEAGIDIYASEYTLAAMDIGGKRRAKILPHTYKKIGDFEVLRFSLYHDAEEPIGFIIRNDNEYMLFVTDTSHIKYTFKCIFNIVAIECSYNADILQEKVDAGEINESLAKRLLESHMSSDECKRYLKEFCDLSRCTEIHLLHLSGNNIVKEQVAKEFEDEFLIETIICGD